MPIVRKIMLFSLALTLCACGFQPTYGTKTFENGGSSPVVKDALSNIVIDIIPDRSGQFLRNRLIDNLYKNGYPSAPHYRLSIGKIEEKIVEIGIDKDATASRAQLRMNVPFTLYDLRGQNPAPVLQRMERSTTGYNILSGQFTTYVTQADAREQGLSMLAEQIMAQLELYVSRTGERTAP